MNSMALGGTFELGGWDSVQRRSMEFSIVTDVSHLKERIVHSLIFLIYILEVLLVSPYFGIKDLFIRRTNFEGMFSDIQIMINCQHCPRREKALC